MLIPRQEVTPTPYAIYAETASSDNDWMISGNNMYSIPTGRVGIGTETPLSKLHIAGSQPFLRLETNSTFMSGIEFMASGDRKWAIFTDTGGWSLNNLSFRDTAAGATRLFIDPDGKVGIGTTSPDRKLSVVREPPTNNINPVALFRTTGSTNSSSSIRFQNTNNNHFNIGITRDDAFGIAYNSNISQNSDLLRISSTGNVGIGTTSPQAGLHLKGTGYPSSFMYLQSDADEDTGFRLYEDTAVKWHLFNDSALDGLSLRNNAYSSVLFAEQSTGNVGIGTTTPSDELHVVGDTRLDDTSGNMGVRLRGDGQGNGGQISLYDYDGTQTVKILGAMTSSTGGQIWLYKADGTPSLGLNGDSGGDSRVITDELEIRGGSDLSEQFDINGVKDAVKPGMLVSIDPKRLGKLQISNGAYDNKVAGIISGAGGIKPGMLMGQKGSAADGVYPVALTGRVYCWADASTGAIQAGDMLTTSSIPGHAMKATDRERSYGAVIGKAMSSLDEGRGLVFVLVNLQ
jgi:hypothetical protein